MHSFCSPLTYCLSRLALTDTIRLYSLTVLNSCIIVARKYLVRLVRFLASSTQLEVISPTAVTLTC